MNKGISSEIRRILSDWSTISDIVDNMQISGVTEDTIMQTVSRMKRNGEVESRNEDIYGRTIKSYKMLDQ